jgi:hypothetical protein
MRYRVTYLLCHHGSDWRLEGHEVGHARAEPSRARPAARLANVEMMHQEER